MIPDLLHRILYRHRRRRAAGAHRTLDGVGDDLFGDKGPGAVVDGDIVFLCLFQAAANRSRPGGAAGHHHRGFFAVLGQLLHLFQVCPCHQHDLADLGVSFQRPDAVLQHRQTLQGIKQLVKPHTGGTSRRHNDGRYSNFLHNSASFGAGTDRL